MNRIPVVAVSIGMATGIYAVSFGALGVTAGLSILETMLLSLLMFSGASQFAFVGVVATGGMAAIPTAIASAWLLGVRNGFYALRMAPVLGMPGISKLSNSNCECLVAWCQKWLLCIKNGSGSWNAGDFQTFIRPADYR